MRPLTPKFPKLLHGGDYNPEQWLRYPEILKQDVELMKKADINCVSVGIFSWAHLEPNEGEYDFDWLRRSSTISTKTAFIPCWPHRPVQSRFG